MNARAFQVKLMLAQRRFGLILEIALLGVSLRMNEKTN